MKIQICLGKNGRLRVVAPSGVTWGVPGPMVPTPRALHPARTILGPAPRSVLWAKTTLETRCN